MLYSPESYKKMIAMLEHKGFIEIDDLLWKFEQNSKFIEVEIDFGGFIKVNFSGKLVKILSPMQVMNGLNKINGKNELEV